MLIKDRIKEVREFYKRINEFNRTYDPVKLKDEIVKAVKEVENSVSKYLNEYKKEEEEEERKLSLLEAEKKEIIDGFFYQNKAWLELQYNFYGKTLKEIAEMCNRAEGTIGLWLKKFKIRKYLYYFRRPKDLKKSIKEINKNLKKYKIRINEDHKKRLNVEKCTYEEKEGNFVYREWERLFFIQAKRIIQTWNDLMKQHSKRVKLWWQDPENKKYHSEIMKRKWQDPELRKKWIESFKNRPWSKESRKKLSESLKGHEVIEETRRKLSESHTGVKLSKEHVKRIIESHQKPEYRKEQSELLKKYYVDHPEKRKKRSEITKKLWEDPNFRTKVVKAKTGKKHSIETKEKMSKAHIGKKLSEEAKKKMSENRKRENNPFYGKHHSEETKKKLSEKAKACWKERKKIKRR